MVRLEWLSVWSILIIHLLNANEFINIVITIKTKQIQKFDLYIQ